MSMLARTFYRGNGDTRGQGERRAALVEMRKATECLQKLLLHEGEHSKDTVVLIDGVTKQLQRLRGRLERHAELVKGAKEEKRKLLETQDALNKRVDEVESNVARTNLESVNLLSQCDKIRRDILLARRSLELKVRDPEQGMESGGDSFEHAPPSLRIENMCEDDWNAVATVVMEDENETENVSF